MRALVTGASGFVGTHLINYLRDQGDTVIGTYWSENPPSNVDHSMALNISDRAGCERVVAEAAPDVIFHLAAISFVPDAERNFTDTLVTNVAGVEHLLAATINLKKLPRFVFASSAEVYGKIDPQKLPITEQCETRPANSYSLSKLMAELVVEKYQRVSGLEAVIFRSFNHIGPAQRAAFVAAAFAGQLATIAKGKAPAVMKAGNLEARRDFCDVRDVVRAYRAAAFKGSGTYNLCSGKAVPVRRLLDLLLEISGLSVEVVPDPSRMRPAEVPEVVGSYAKANQEWGWLPEIELRASLEALYRSALEQA